MTESAFAGASRFSIYTGRATNWPLAAGAAAMVLPIFVLGDDSKASWWGLAAPLLSSAAILVVCALIGSSVRTTAGPNGVSVHVGVLGWPRCTYRLDQIERAEVIDLSPWYVAGGFWWTPRHTCCTVRRGPTLRLVLRNGRSVTITAPNPRTAIAAIDLANTA
jgi:hypothetical protein